jgi:xylan 1,4-beta-xylosidase
MIQKNVTVDVKGAKKPFSHFFRATGYANADYTYTEPVKRMYDCLDSYEGHPRFMRLHNIMSLHGKGDYYITEKGCDYGNPISNSSSGVDVVVSLDPEGHLSFDWELVDKVYDIILSHEMHPIAEMVYMPSALMKSEAECCLPKDYKLWETAVEAFVRHWVDRYGKEEVRQWYFEVINEPENYDAINRDPATFMALYDYFEKGVHAVDPELKAGGPAVKQWDEGKRIFRLFLDHCSKSVNYCSGTYGTRVDFISVHCKAGYPDRVGPQTDYMFDSLRDYAAILKEYPCYAGTEFFNDESDIVWDGNQGTAVKSWLGFRNTAYAAGFTCKMIDTYCRVVQDELGLELSVVDSDNSHLTWEKSFFSGNRSQFTPFAPAPCSDIMKKPVFNAFPLLGKLGTERFLLSSPDPEFGTKYGALATARSGGGYAVMLWNFEDGLFDDANERTISLSLTGLDSDREYEVLHFRIDGTHSNGYAVWKSMGSPERPDAEQMRKLRAGDGLQLFEAPSSFSGETFGKEVTLPMHGVSLLVLAEKAALADETEIGTAAPVAKVETNSLGNPQVFLSWSYSKRPDFLGYRVFRTGPDGEELLLSDWAENSCSYYFDNAVEPGTYGYRVEAVYAGGGCSAKTPSCRVDVK